MLLDHLDLQRAGLGLCGLRLSPRLPTIETSESYPGTAQSPRDTAVCEHSFGRPATAPGTCPLGAPSRKAGALVGPGTLLPPKGRAFGQAPGTRHLIGTPGLPARAVAHAGSGPSQAPSSDARRRRAGLRTGRAGREHVRALGRAADRSGVTRSRSRLRSPSRITSEIAAGSHARRPSPAQRRRRPSRGTPQRVRGIRDLSSGRRRRCAAGSIRPAGTPGAGFGACVVTYTEWSSTRSRTGLPSAVGRTYVTLP